MMSVSVVLRFSALNMTVIVLRVVIVIVENGVVDAGAVARLRVIGLSSDSCAKPVATNARTMRNRIGFMSCPLFTK
jgi:hypothetical protein